jgi:hypothetical protein
MLSSDASGTCERKGFFQPIVGAEDRSALAVGEALRLTLSHGKSQFSDLVASWKLECECGLQISLQDLGEISAHQFVLSADKGLG